MLKARLKKRKSFVQKLTRIRFLHLKVMTFFESQPVGNIAPRLKGI